MSALFPVGLGAFASMAVVMTVLWWVQLRTRNASAVDVAWAFGTGACAVAFAVAAEGPPLRRALVAGLALAWSLRLGAHLLRRVRGAAEDARYAHLRARLGHRAPPVFLGFFLLQASWCVLFALPMAGAAANPHPFPSALDLVGLVLGAVAVLGEAVADRQLARFRASAVRSDTVCRSGLWRYSRHPNYFFEWLGWWAWVAIAWSGPGRGLALLGPVLMYVFLTRLTGIPFLEARSLERHGDAYRAYQRRTSAFFPWPPRSPET